MSLLSFDDEIARRLEALYLTKDAERRRRLVQDALMIGASDKVLDVGCGPGFYCRELAEAVGPDGMVVGLDLSPSMLALARARCEGYDNVTFEEGEVLALPFGDGSFDRALCIQVLEYVDDATAALAEIGRVLRPGGRAVIWDTDWATVSWHSDDPPRMHQVMHAWDSHLRNPSLPRTLGPRLRSVGFDEVEATGHVFVTTGPLDDQSFITKLIPVIVNYVIDNNLLPRSQVLAWQEEQRLLSERREAHFSFTQFCFKARRPT